MAVQNFPAATSAPAAGRSRLAMKPLTGRGWQAKRGRGISTAGLEASGAGGFNFILLDFDLSSPQVGLGQVTRSLRR